MVVLETVCLTDHGVRMTQRLLSAALTMAERSALLDHAAEAVSEPEQNVGLVFEAEAHFTRRLVVGAQDRLGTDLVVIGIRPARQADYVRELAPALQALAALGEAEVTMTAWHTAGRYLDAGSLQALGLSETFAQTIHLVSLPYAPMTIQAQQAAELIRAEYDLPLKNLRATPEEPHGPTQDVGPCEEQKTGCPPDVVAPIRRT
ncbi:hypothetical protein [Deinococcus multiflagellatus]|uniref:Uncharacterized protein n=1 Tax=Deinococcus multiflagellatus TaxID=1656887 RepID=A0ABW1ZQ10_9DEIO|nr:hypothetical protein [Deinococcus multiflagellatus]MBZ9715830.1 hypothetical protein [Deinococcus multiflagellatus]